MSANTLNLARAATANKILLEESLRHAVALERYKVSEVRRIQSLLKNKVLPDAVSKLRARLDRIKVRGVDASVKRTARMKQMVATIEAQSKAIVNVGRGVQPNLLELSKLEAGWASSALSEASPVGLSLVAPAASQLRAIVTSQPMRGKLLKDWWGGLEKGSRDRLNTALKIGLTQGESTPQIASRFAKELNTTVRQATANVRTAVNHVGNRAREEVYKANQDVIKSEKIVATLDSRTTDICMSLDGREFPIGKGPRPPFHHQCRTITVPVMKSWKELGIDLKEAPPGTRASMNGQVPAKVTYSDFLKKQTNEFQNDVLGKGRAQIFRKGKVPLRRFVDRNLKPLTLDELKVLESKIVTHKPFVKMSKVVKHKPEQMYFESRESTFGELQNGDTLKIGNNRGKVVSNITTGDKSTIKFEMHNADGSITTREMTQLSSKKTPGPVTPKADMRRSYRAKEMNRAEQVKTIEKNISDRVHNGWFRKEDKAFKREISETIEKSQETRDAALNIMHTHIENVTGKKIPFNEFLDTEYTFYRGGSISADDARDTFLSFTPDRKIAQTFADKSNGQMWQIKLKPSQTFGSMQTIAEAEVMIPANTARKATRSIKRKIISVTKPKPILNTPELARAQLRKLKEARTIAQKKSDEIWDKVLDSKALSVSDKSLVDTLELSYLKAERQIDKISKEISTLQAKKINVRTEGLARGKDVRKKILELEKKFVEPTFDNPFDELRENMSKVEMLADREPKVKALIDELATIDKAEKPVSFATTQNKLKRLRFEVRQDLKQKFVKEATTKGRKITTEVKAFEKTRSEAYHKVLEVPSEFRAKVNNQYPDSFELHMRERGNTAKEYLSRVVNKDVIKGDITSVEWNADDVLSYKYVKSDKKRAMFFNETGVTVHTTSTERVYVHEMFHGVENQSRELGDKARDFLKKRTGTEKPKSLKELTGLDFPHHEIAVKDQFDNPYMGRIYEWGDTELLSMASEECFIDAARFAKADPEMFDWFVDAIRGHLH